MRSELALDLALPSAAATAKLEDYVKGLEEERRKIEGFRRELPLCIYILNEKIERLKEELAECRGQARPEEFASPIPAKVEESEAPAREDKDFKDKVNWMSSAQLWSDNHSANTSSTTDAASSSNSQKNSAERAAENRFLSFKETKEEAAPLPDLSLLPPAAKDHLSASSISKQPMPSSPQASRKPRRCWSPELHRRFVKSLQQLGGAHAATPKQIRELMKVDGLTNDEVKSHLQKYRLHTRRAPSSSSPEKHPVLLMGGLWPAAEKQTTGSPQGPLHLANAGEDSGEEDDGRSESFGWKGRLQRINGEETD